METKKAKASRATKATPPEGSAVSSRARAPSLLRAEAVSIIIPESQVISQALHCPPIHSPAHLPPPGLTCPAGTAADRQKIIKTAAKIGFSFFIRDSFSFQSEITARRIIAQAEVAHSLRRTSELELLSQQLKSINRFESIGAYYNGLAAITRGDLWRARQLFEQAAEDAPARYKARAILSLGCIESYRGNIDDERRHYARALSIEQADHWTRIETARAVALLTSFEGDHLRAVELLESLYPIARHFARVSPRLHLDLLNSLAVEYAAIGQIEAAREAFKPVLQSALINSIAEYRETAQDLAASELRASAVIVKKSDARPRSISHRQIERAARRINKPDNKEVFDDTARSDDAITLIINRVKLHAPIRAPSPSII